MQPQLFKEAARSVFAPSLFHLQWDDAVFPRSGQLELFGLLASRTKRLLSCSGPHTESPPDAVEIWQAFAARHLADSAITDPRKGAALTGRGRLAETSPLIDQTSLHLTEGAARTVSRNPGRHSGPW